MAIVSVRIPQMGEGLQEALLVEFIKKPGDMIKRDEAIYIMETDKASTEVESPFTGKLIEWTVTEGTVLAIGTEVARMEVTDEVAATAAPSHGHGPAATAHTSPTATTSAASSASSHDDESDSEGGVNIPPRTRKYLKEKGLQAMAHLIPVAGSKMMPEDVDRYLASGGSTGSPSSQPSPSSSNVGGPFTDSPVSKGQVTLNYRLLRGVQSSVPVSIMIEVDWTKIEAARQVVKARGGQETGFAMMLWCVTETLKKHPMFRTTLIEEGKTFRTFEQVNLGIAVALPGDALVTAVVHNAGGHDRSNFFQAVATRIESARNGVDQADASTTISISNIGSAGIRWGIPAVVPPAVATLALGEVFEAVVRKGTEFASQKRAQLTLAFDHRILNGVGAANFMNDLKAAIESYTA